MLVPPLLLGPLGSLGAGPCLVVESLGGSNVAKAPEVGTFIFLFARFTPDVPVALCPVSDKGLVYPPVRAALNPAP